MEFISAILQRFSTPELLLLAINTLLLLSAGWIDRRLPSNPTPRDGFPSRLRIFRLLNLLPILLILGINLIWPGLESLWPLRVLAVFLAGYLVYLTFHISSWLIRARFAKPRQVGDELHWVDTYNTRLLILLTAASCAVLGLIAVIRILGFDSLLEAGGVIGFVGVMLALTQAAWAPDIIAGLIILNSKLLEEGDVIRFSDEQPERLGLVFKTKMFHTELLDLTNNHRRMLSNASLRQIELRNLSKFASAKGLRECLAFKIGYGESPERVRQALTEGYAAAIADPEVSVEDQHPPEIVVLDTGDYAITWGLFYYSKSVKQLVKTRQRIREAIWQAASQAGVELATPVLISGD